MAKNLVDIRKEAVLINQKMRDNNLTAALAALKDVVSALITEPLNRVDRKEMETMAENGAFAIMLDPQVSKEFAMEIKYEVGKEKKVLEDLNILIHAVNEAEANKAEEARKEQILKLTKETDDAIETYTGGNVEKAEKVFKKMLSDFRIDPNDLVKIGLMYMEGKKYEESIPYFEKAIDINAREASWYNYIGISLRKVHRFEDAEQYYLKVSKISGSDPHLFFNLARLYLDWEQWEKAIKSAAAAVKLDPEFVEAQKLMKYAQKQDAVAKEKAAAEAEKAEAEKAKEGQA